jgi:hypothetical protein
MNDQKDNGMVIIPAYHQGINAQNEIDYTFFFAAHIKLIVVLGLGFLRKSSTGRYLIFIFNQIVYHPIYSASPQMYNFLSSIHIPGFR